MDAKIAKQLVAEGNALDQGLAAHAEAAANGSLDASGQIVAPDPDAELNRKAADWFMIPKALAWAITTVFPETKQHYTDEACMDLARSIVPVGEKYGLNGVGDSPELTLLIGTAFFCAPGYMAYQARKELALKAQQAARAQKGGDAAPVTLEPSKEGPQHGG